MNTRCEGNQCRRSPLQKGIGRQASRFLALFVVACVITAAYCARGSGRRTESKSADAATAASNAPAGSFSLKSPAFEPAGLIPARFSCQGTDTSPALSWTDPPARTQAFALIADDPDAPSGTWVHWVAYDLPASQHQLTEGIPKEEELRGGGRQGRNDFQKIGYGGPCPPPGKPHRYFFKLYALDAKLNLKPGATKKDVEEAMKGHVLSKAELIGRFGR